MSTRARVAPPRPSRAAARRPTRLSRASSSSSSNERPSTTTTATVEVALKEWAIVVDALRRGEQIAIARKGGVADAKGAFTPRRGVFALFPTNHHADVSAWEGAAETRAPNMKDGASVSLDVVAEASAAWRVRGDKSRDALAMLSRRSGWPEDVFAKRANWRADAPLTILFLRAYETAETTTLEPDEKRYGGCKSWVAIDAWRPTMTPVVSDEAYVTMSASIEAELRALGAEEWQM